MKRLILLLLFFLNSALAQYHNVTGLILDEESGSPLSFANVRIDGTTQGATSNYEGEFVLKLKAGRYNLIFSYVGYKTDTILVRVPEKVKNDYKIRLQPQAVKLPEVIVSSEDPAYRIIREAIKHKKENRAGLVNFEYDAYSKNILRSAGEVALIEETFFKGYNKVGKWEKEFILSTHKTENRKKQGGNVDFKVSENFFIDFSRDTLSLFMNLIYLPIADNAFDYYDYKLLDIKETDAGDIYRIQVIPQSKIQPLLKGEITIEGNNYALVGINLENNEGVRFIFVNDLSAKFVQQLGRYDGYWLPNYIETEAAFAFSLQGIIGIEKMQFDNISSIASYKINGEIPDSIEKAVHSRFGGFTADTSKKVRKPAELTREEMNSRRPVPLTQSETKAYEELDSTKTLEKMIKVTGALSGLVTESSTQKDTSSSILGTVFNILSNYVAFGNNRVSGILIGLRYEDFLIKNKLYANFTGEYSFGRKKVEADLKLTYKLKNLYFNEIEAGFFNRSKRCGMFSPYPDLINGISVTLGYDDQFNYYLSSGFTIGVIKKFNGDFSVKTGYISEKENSLKEMKYQGIINTDRVPRRNPAIIEGYDRRASINLQIGKNPMEFQIMPENGLIAQYDYSDRLLGSDFDYKKFRITGMLKMKTIFKELFIAPYLQIIADAGIVKGSFGPQHLLSPNTSMGFFAPAGVLKGPAPYSYAGNEMVALQIEHNWRTIPFQALGLKFISDTYLDFLTGASVMRTWNKSEYQIAPEMDKPYWEAYLGISRIMGAIRIDVGYNSLKKYSVTAGIGVIL